MNIKVAEAIVEEGANRLRGKAIVPVRSSNGVADLGEALVVFQDAQAAVADQGSGVAVFQSDIALAAMAWATGIS